MGAYIRAYHPKLRLSRVIRFGKLVMLYDDNSITIDGPKSLLFTEDVDKWYDAYGWHTVIVEDIANGLNNLHASIAQLQAG